MTRFDAAGPEERTALVADAIAAHRERGSGFCTVEADEPPASGRHEPADAGGDAGRESPTDAGAGEGEAATGVGATPAWIQYDDAEGVLNLDCTDAEYDRITDVLAEFPALSVAEQHAPEDAEGRNLRIAARADAERVAAAVDRLFREGYGYAEEFRLWATEV